MEGCCALSQQLSRSWLSYRRDIVWLPGLFPLKIKMVIFLSNNKCCASSLHPAHTHPNIFPTLKGHTKATLASSKQPSFPPPGQWGHFPTPRGSQQLPCARSWEARPPSIHPAVFPQTIHPLSMQTALQPPSWGTTSACEEEQQGKMEALSTSQSEVHQSNTHPMNTHSGTPHLPSANQLPAAWPQGREDPSPQARGWRGRWTPTRLGASPQGRGAAGAPSSPPTRRQSWLLLPSAFMEGRKVAKSAPCPHRAASLLPLGWKEQVVWKTEPKLVLRL